MPRENPWDKLSHLMRVSFHIKWTVRALPSGHSIYMHSSCFQDCTSLLFLLIFMIYGVLDIFCIYVFQLVFKFLPGLSNSFRIITGLKLHWMGDGPVGAKDAENSAIWWFSHRTVWSDCSLSSGATRVHVPAAYIFKETTTYLGICHNLSIFSPSSLWLLYNLFFCFSIFFLRFFLREKQR